VFEICELPVQSGREYPVWASAAESLVAMRGALEVLDRTGAPVVATLRPDGTLDRVGPMTHALPSDIRGELVRGSPDRVRLTLG
jgi:hypothetical protein